jgi:hypothetical protein
MAYKDKIQKIAEDKKVKDRIEYFSNRKFGKMSGSEKDKKEMIDKLAKRKNISKKDAKTYIASQLIQDDIKKFKPKFKASDNISEKNLSKKEGSFKSGGLVKSGKPKIAKKGWR